MLTRIILKKIFSFILIINIDVTYSIITES